MASPIALYRRTVPLLITALAVGACTSDDAVNEIDSVDTTVAATSRVDEQFTPVLMEIFSTPRWFTGSDGLVHLVYELQLTNGFPVPATVTEVEVRDVASGEAIETLSGEHSPRMC